MTNFQSMGVEVSVISQDPSEVLWLLCSDFSPFPPTLYLFIYLGFSSLSLSWSSLASPSLLPGLLIGFLVLGEAASFLLWSRKEDNSAAA